MILGIDAGNHETKVCYAGGMKKFPSEIGLDYRERNLEQNHGEFDFVWQYRGKRGFAGTLAKYESECAESRKGDSKAHFDALIRILIAIHQFSREATNDIVVGQPIGTHTAEEKLKIKDMLIGEHDFSVNHNRRQLRIRRCEVAAEGVVAGLLQPAQGTFRVIDIGSGTVNYGTLQDMRFVDRDSFTINTGLNTIRNREPEAIARLICIKALTKWRENEQVRLCGGGAEILLPHIRSYFSNATLIPDPIFANAKAFYEIARKLYAHS